MLQLLLFLISVIIARDPSFDFKIHPASSRSTVIKSICIFKSSFANSCSGNLQLLMQLSGRVMSISHQEREKIFIQTLM